MFPNDYNGIIYSLNNISVGAANAAKAYGQYASTLQILADQADIDIFGYNLGNLVLLFSTRNSK